MKSRESNFFRNLRGEEITGSKLSSFGCLAKSKVLITENQKHFIEFENLFSLPRYLGSNVRKYRGFYKNSDI